MLLQEPITLWLQLPRHLACSGQDATAGLDSGWRAVWVFGLDGTLVRLKSVPYNVFERQWKERVGKKRTSVLISLETQQTVLKIWVPI